MSENLIAARAQLERAMQEPGHSPTEDALLDALAAIFDAIEAIEQYLEKVAPTGDVS